MRKYCLRELRKQIVLLSWVIFVVLNYLAL